MPCNAESRRGGTKNPNKICRVISRPSSPERTSCSRCTGGLRAGGCRNYAPLIRFVMLICRLSIYTFVHTRHHHTRVCYLTSHRGRVLVAERIKIRIRIHRSDRTHVCVTTPVIRLDSSIAAHARGAVYNSRSGRDSRGSSHSTDDVRLLRRSATSCICTFVRDQACLTGTTSSKRIVQLRGAVGQRRDVMV